MAMKTEMNLFSFSMILLITDGRITEKRTEYDEAFEQINSLDLFRNAKRYAAIVDLEMDRELSDNAADNEILNFLSDFDARKRFRLAVLSAEVSKFSFLADNEQENPFI